jgi:inorganic triphosphatase YgiF
MSERDQEIELKFVCGADDLAAVLAAAPPPDEGDDEAPGELISVYFDTSDLALQKAGASLRVREREGRRVQTLKRGEGMTREEHEAPIEGLAPDPALGPLPELVPKDAALKPAFNVRVTRRQRTFRYQGAVIELALDQGEVVGGEARAPICEVELELKSGPPAALFALARELAAAAPLHLSFESKAARGQALVAGAAGRPQKSVPVSLEGDETVSGAFQATARAALAQVAANAALLRAQPTAGAVHELRVGARRFRSALSTFGQVLADDGLAGVKAEMKWLCHACDRVRNLDVFAESLGGAEVDLGAPSAGAATLRKLTRAAQRKARAAVAETVGAERFRRLMIEAAAWVETGAWQLHDAARAPVKPFARAALARRRRKVLKHGAALAVGDDHARHKLRIAAKKLRYAGDAFAGLYSKKRVAAFAKRVKALQTELGDLNDLATATPLVASLSLPADAAFAAGELLGLRLAARPARLRRATKVFDKLADAAPFWR